MLSKLVVTLIGSSLRDIYLAALVPLVLIPICLNKWFEFAADDLLFKFCTELKFYTDYYYCYEMDEGLFNPKAGVYLKEA